MSKADEQRDLQLAYSLHQRGNFAEAAKSYRALIKRSPNNFHALHFLGLIEANNGNIVEAKNLMARSLSIRPPNIQFIENYATILYKTDDYEATLQACRDGLKIENKNAPLLYLGAISLFKLNKLEESLAGFDKLLSLHPRHIAGHNERGSVLAEMERYESALASVDKALNIDQRYADAHLNRGNICGALKRYDEALAAYDKALTLAPGLANAWLGRGNLLRDLKRYDEALAAYDKALALNPDLANAWLGRGNVFHDRHRLDEALQNYGKAIALKANFADAYAHKARVLLEIGRLDEASREIEQAIKLAPRRTRFYHNLAMARRLTAGEFHLNAMEELARDRHSLAVDEQIELNFALGKALADVGDRERSFRLLLDGNSLKRKQTHYDEAASLGSLARTRTIFTDELMRGNAGSGDPSSVPIFILGMPRSGTTLVEQILASHPKVFGAGEIDDFGEAAGRLIDNYPETIASMPGDRFRALGAAYLDRTRDAAPWAERITNKMPDNFRLAGLIHLALPKARIIHTRRDPIDTCLSCFSILFAGNLGFAYDLAELGRYYRGYEALMAHWRAVLPPDVMLEVQYEEVVADLEGQARRIIAHCGLEWDANCLDFHKTARPVRTSSITQVRRPIYDSSVGRWRAYEAFLGPLLAELAPAGAGSVPASRV
jgi:tetratricopeptide (TPR) repeat protein